jgi:hypothetical protein
MNPPEAIIPPPVPARAVAPRRRCVRHEEREAVARCVDCGGGFCRECITEHDDRLYCAPCFARRAAAVAAEKKKRGARSLRGLRPLAVGAGSVLCLVLGFYFLGRVLAAIPSDFHDGTIWREVINR